MTKEKEPTFKFTAKTIPTESGCYLFYDKNENLIYVGKAKNLRNRVKSYFQKTKKSTKTELMVSKIQKIETRITNSEIESLILENNLIKQNHPRFNILLRDDKNFLYLRITNETFPRLEIVRRLQKDGSFYFGPKTSAKGFRQTIAFCQKIFQVRTCKVEIDENGQVQRNPENKKIPCMDFHIKKCSAPCNGTISAEEYQSNVDNLKKFLRGKTAPVLTSLKDKMLNFAASKNFEAAAKLRDLITSIETTTAKQTVQFLNNFEADFVNFMRDGNTTFFIRTIFRDGKFLDQNEIELRTPAQAEDSDILEKFLVQFYEKADKVPAEIFLPEEIENQINLEEFLETKISVPQKGDKKKILEMSFKAAKNFAKKSQIEKMSHNENFTKALPELCKVLNIESARRIECYDISHFAGKNTVASMVVFHDGTPLKSEYRKFKIKTLPEGKIDDFASMKEVLNRRFLALKKDLAEQAIKAEEAKLKEMEEEEEEEEEEAAAKLEKENVETLPATSENDTVETNCNLSEENNEEMHCDVSPENNVETLKETSNKKTKDTKKKTTKPKKEKKVTKLVPDLIVIDGGKGQLSSVMKIVNKLTKEDPEFGKTLEKINIISLAKREEEVFLPNEKEPIILPLENPALKLLQRLRDEAHRFAIDFNRKSRDKDSQKSILDQIEGIGGVTKKKLIKKFGSVRDVKNSTDEELLEVLNKKQLSSLRKFL